ncbi:MAG: hypothetical protein HY081_00665 [Gammaproteobacteria bacterium]|nr:hypothetical protein [Gammaproteobacteria bacterium]
MKYDDEKAKLANRRQYLLAQIHYEREDLAQKGAALRVATQIIDKIRNGIHHVTRHPETLLLPLVLTLITRPRRLWTWGISGLGAWRMLQTWRQRIFS